MRSADVQPAVSMPRSSSGGWANAVANAKADAETDAETDADAHDGGERQIV